jgi:hypothetical protein
LNVVEIIDAFGGYRQAGKLLGVSRSQLGEWTQSGIPPKRWEHIATVAAVIGRDDITFDVVRAAAGTSV